MPSGYNEMHPVMEALAIGRRQGSVKTKQWEMRHIITDHNSRRKYYFMDKSWGGRGKKRRKGRNPHSEANK